MSIYGGKLTLLLAWSSSPDQIGSMIFIFIICFGGIVGIAMGWGFLSQKIGGALLLAVPIFLIVAFALEPVITGERQRSTAGVGLFLTILGISLAAAIGSAVGMLGHWLNSRK